jgi:hypothetical protein
MKQQRLIKLRLDYINAILAKWYNKKHKNALFEIRDEVLVLAKNIKTIRSKKKLDNKYLDPYRITERLSPVTYRLELPKDLEIYNVFYITLLEKRKRSERFSAKELLFWDTIAGDQSNIYEV